jgi:hypothetical protein
MALEMKIKTIVPAQTECKAATLVLFTTTSNYHTPFHGEKMSELSTRNEMENASQVSVSEEFLSRSFIGLSFR